MGNILKSIPNLLSLTDILGFLSSYSLVCLFVIITNLYCPGLVEDKPIGKRLLLIFRCLDAIAPLTRLAMTKTEQTGWKGAVFVVLSVVQAWW